MISPAPLVDAQQLPEDILRQVLELLNRLLDLVTGFKMTLKSNVDLG